MTPNYVSWIRSRVGHDKIIMTSAAGLIRDERGRVLLQKRRDNNLWGFPGGMQELGETAAQAACREVREEVGLEVEAKRLIGIYTTPDLDRIHANGDVTQVFIAFFECAITGGTLKPQDEEVLEIGWFDFDQLPPLQPCCIMKAADARAFQGEAFFR